MDQTTPNHIMYDLTSCESNFLNFQFWKDVNYTF